MNIEFLVISYFVGLFVDWIFQSDWQASNKSKWEKCDNKFNSFSALISHSVVYAILTTYIVNFCTNITNINAVIMILVLFITHMMIDTRIPVKYIMKLKGMSDDQINDSVRYGFLHIGIDHRLHELVLFILSFFMR